MIEINKTKGIDDIMVPISFFGWQIFFVVLLFLIFIGGIIWFIIEYDALHVCQTTESFPCPSIFCNDLADGSSGTKCYIPGSNGEQAIGRRVGWRYDKDGKLQCQNYTLPDNTVTSFDY